jgi:hypothetical protein
MKYVCNQSGKCHIDLCVHKQPHEQVLSCLTPYDCSCVPDKAVCEPIYPGVTNEEKAAMGVR